MAACTGCARIDAQLTHVIVATERMAIVTLLHVDLLVRDISTSIEFYVGQLGGEIVEDTVLVGEAASHIVGANNGQLRVAMIRFSPTGTMVELLQILSPAPQFPTPTARALDVLRPSIMNLSFLVTSVTDTLEQLAEAGVATVGSPSRVNLPRLGSGRVAFVCDPDGNLIELVEPIR